MAKQKSAFQFAIVTPAFNQAHFLADCVEGVLTQHWQPTAFQIMDGGSSDDTVTVLKRYGQNIKWQSKPDKGQSDAINQGFKKIFTKLAINRSVICAYINSDDYYLPDCFEKVAAAFEAHPDQDWLIGDCQIINAEGRRIQTAIQWYKRFWRRFLSPQLLAVLNPIPQPAVFFRASAWQQVGNFNQDLRYTMDYDYWLRLYQRCGKPIMLSDELAAFRIHGQSKGGSQFIKQFDEEAQVALQYNQNAVLSILHQLHNWLIKTVYRVIK